MPTKFYSSSQYVLTSKSDELLNLRMKSVLLFLKRLRVSRCISQKTLANLVGIDVSNLNKIEKGVTVPRLDTLLRILNVLEYYIVFEDDYLPF